MIYRWAGGGARDTKLVQRVIAFVTVLTAISTPVVAQPPGLVVSVAASVYDALEEIAGLYRAATGVTIALNAGGSNTLARQIVEGAKAAVFISADDRQMDLVEKAGRIAAGTRTRLLTNELAVIVPATTAGDVTVARVLEGRVTRLAMGEPAAVPAGVYGRTWLERQGAWPRLESKIVPFPTVTAVLSAVANGRVDAGIVYRTDAMASKGVRVIARVVPKEHPYLDISYPAAVVAGPSEKEARRFLEFLKGPEARAVFDRRGFGKPSFDSPKPQLGLAQDLR
jgi:molybdate transport system substrate-binding protein